MYRCARELAARAYYELEKLARISDGGSHEPDGAVVYVAGTEKAMTAEITAGITYIGCALAEL